MKEGKECAASCEKQATRCRLTSCAKYLSMMSGCSYADRRSLEDGWQRVPLWNPKRNPDMIPCCRYRAKSQSGWLRRKNSQASARSGVMIFNWGGRCVVTPDPCWQSSALRSSTYLYLPWYRLHRVWVKWGAARNPGGGKGKGMYTHAM